MRVEFVDANTGRGLRKPPRAVGKWLDDRVGKLSAKCG